MTNHQALTNASSLKVIPLGGLGEIGLNMLVLECDDAIVLIDAGLMFPEDDMLGVDIVIPDFSYLRQHRDRIKGLIVTHGHEDHIGAIPFLAREFNLPMYATALTLALGFRLRESAETHRRIYEAIRSRSAERARREMTQHLEHARWEQVKREAGDGRKAATRRR